ncbi:MAG: hypothetical protein GWP32_02820 [Bacteroidetes bacterium]|nr:hypothetical protein [Bacteroidota bacterium]
MIDIYVNIDDSFTAAEAWNPDGSYTKGDRVYDNSNQSINNLSPIYVCVNDNSNSAPSSSNTNWILAGTSPEYPLLTKDPMETSIVDITHSISRPWEYEWSFDGSNIPGDPVMRHYRMIEEAGGGSVIFMFETFSSPHTGSNNKEAMLRLVPGPILSNTTKITFDSYNKNTTIVINGYGGHPEHAPSLGLLQTDPLDDPRANNYYFNNLTFNSTHGFSSLFGIAAGEFVGCKFIKTEYTGSSGGGGHRFFTNNNGSKIKAKFVQCLFEQSYGIGVKGESSATEFIGCTFVYNNFDSVNTYAPTSLGGMFSSTFKTFKGNIFYIKKIQDFDPSQSYPSQSKVMHNGTIYMATFGAYAPGSTPTPDDPNSTWGTFDTDLTINAIEKSNNIIYIEGYESDSSYVDIIYQDPMFVDTGSSDYRLRPSSPSIGGFKSSNLAGVYIQPGSGTGGSGTFDDPYYMGELGVAETEAAAGNGIIYFVDGYYEIDSLDFFVDGITYKSLNKHKAILGSNDTSITSAKTINIGGRWGKENLGVGDITLEDFYIKNTRFQQVSNSSSRPNKIKGSKIEETHPITHGTDGLIWSGGGKFIIDSCFIYANFGFETGPYFTRGTTTSEILNSTLIINFPQTSGHLSFVSFASIENSIIYATTEISESGFPALTANSKNCCFYNIGTNVTYSGENTYQGDPKFVDPNSRDFRLRANSPLIGGVNKSKYPMDSVWVQSGTGSGTGTEDDPFYWDQYSDAFLAAVQSSSKQVIFKDGTYIWTNAILQDNNVGNNITMLAENMHQAIFTDNGRISSAGKNPTVRLKGIQLVANDHFTWQSECHYVFDSCHILVGIYIGALSVTASGCIFEIKPGANAYVFSNTGIVDIKNCIFVDHNDRASTYGYLTNISSGTIKSTIFYTKYPTDDCINPSRAPYVSLINCASENITNQQSGIEYFNNLGFIDIENKNYNLRPLSPLIGQGK